MRLYINGIARIRSGEYLVNDINSHVRVDSISGSKDKSRPVVFNLFAKVETQRNIPGTRGTPVQ